MYAKNEGSDRSRHMMQSARLLVAACLSIALAGMAVRSEAADDVYRFIDERGIPHFSNVPLDSRYRLFLQSAALLGSDAIAAPPTVILFAPPIVERGEEFAMSVIFSSSEAVRGWIELGFDPGALMLKAVNMQYDTPQAGRVRLLLRRAGTAFSADLQFQVNARPPEQTSIEFLQASFTTANDRMVSPSIGDAIPIAISSLTR
jgi:hypothetical protein